MNEGTESPVAEATERAVEKETSIWEEIKETLKEEGLDLAEETVKLTIKAMFKVAPVFAAKTSTPMDDMIVAATAPILERELLKVADKIDGKEG